MKLLPLALMLTLLGIHCFGLEATEETMLLNTESTADRQARMQWWKEARFGMFVHWGLYSVAECEWQGVQGTEWIQKQADVPADVYEQTLVPMFKPTPDFPAIWADMAKRSGARYVVFTAKHHEGFSLHDSALTTFDAKDATDRDLAKEIIEALRAEGLRVGLFYSLWDWHHPDAPAGRGAVNVKGTGMEGRELSRYIDYFHGQVEELTDGRYGTVDILWLDFSRSQYQGEVWGAGRLISMIRSHQPDVLINNRLWSNRIMDRDTYAKYWMGDFATPERHIPATGIEGIDWEVCDTLNGSWGWSRNATDYKSVDELVHRLVDTVGKGGNYLLNVGPMGDGSIDPTSRKLMNGIGEWMQVNSESIYGSQAGLFVRLPWGCSTMKQLKDGSWRLYLHVFDWPAHGVLHVPDLQTMPSNCILLGDTGSQELRAVEEDGKVLIAGLPETPLHSAATVLALEYDKVPVVGPHSVYASEDGSFSLEPIDAEIQTGDLFQDHGRGMPPCLKNWKTGGRAVIPLFSEKESAYRIKITAATHKFDPYNTYYLSVGGEEVPLKLQETGGLDKFNQYEAGPITLPAGHVKLVLGCHSQLHVSDMAISAITLIPEKLVPAY